MEVELCDKCGNKIENFEGNTVTKIFNKESSYITKFQYKKIRICKKCSKEYMELTKKFFNNLYNKDIDKEEEE